MIPNHRGRFLHRHDQIKEDAKKMRKSPRSYHIELTRRERMPARAASTRGKRRSRKSERLCYRQ